jgi:hypothetical protein
MRRRLPQLADLFDGPRSGPPDRSTPPQGRAAAGPSPQRAIAGAPGRRDALQLTAAVGNHFGNQTLSGYDTDANDDSRPDAS